MVKVLSWMAAVIKPQHPVIMGVFLPLISKMDIILRTRGEIGLVEWCKAVRLALLHHLSGEYPSKRVKGVPVTKDGLPKVLVPVLGKSKLYNTTLLRLVLTLLYSTRALQLGRIPDVRAIQDPPKADLPDLSKHVVSFWRDLGYRPSATKVPRGVYFKSFHMTTKAGPNGHALWTSMVDLKLLVGHADLLAALKVVGGPKFQKILDLLIPVIHLLPKSIFPVEGRLLRRLSYFPDKEVKVRVVAILDYWSQTVLRAFHDYLFKVLRKIPQDCTFNQGAFLDKTKGWKVFHSLDLTSATDRFPIIVICKVLEGLLPSHFVQSWAKIMVGLPFSFKHRNKSEMIYYGVGNPMGAYSSWNSFAIAHHYILYWCCKDLGIDWKTSKYVLLGDDILIGDDLLAKKYLETIQALGVSISELKTHSSTKLFEFAKRLVLEGTEITPFPISSLSESSRRFYLLVNLLREETRKGWTWSSGIPATVDKFYTDVLEFNSRKAVEFRERSFLTEIITDVMRGVMPANDGLIAIIRRHNLPLPELTPEQGISVLSGTALEVFAESNPLDYKQGKPLGQLAEDLVCDLTGSEDLSIEVAACLPQSIPLLSVFGQITDKYLEVGRQAYLIDTLGKGEWPMHLRTLALPISDTVFSERASHTIIRVGAVLGDKVLSNLKGLKASDFIY
nr:MAG: putative RNA-dependent RNA polymerase [Mitoviridae sp.]